MNFYREPYISFFLILKYDVAIWGCVLKDCNSFTRCFIVRNFIKWLIKKKWNFKINYDSFECNLFSQFNVRWRFSPLDFGFQSFNTLCYAPQGKNRILKNSQRLHLWHIGLELNGIIFKVYFLLLFQITCSIPSLCSSTLASLSLLLLPFCAAGKVPTDTNTINFYLDDHGYVISTLWESVCCVVKKSKVTPGCYEDKMRQFMEESVLHISRLRIMFLLKKNVLVNKTYELELIQGYLLLNRSLLKGLSFRKKWLNMNVSL